LAVEFSEERGERCGFTAALRRRSNFWSGATHAILLAAIGVSVRTALGGFA
jgi:hypothetical protein